MLFENEQVDLEYGAVMIQFELPGWQKFVTKFIQKEDLQPQQWMSGNSFYQDAHSTLLFGLSSEVLLSEIKPLLIPLENIEVEFKGIDVLKTPKSDVVVFTIASTQILQLNKVLATLPHTDLYGEYHPHCTIAFVKLGEGEKYIRKIKPFVLRPTKYVFSSPNFAREEFIV